MLERQEHCVPRKGNPGKGRKGTVLKGSGGDSHRQCVKSTRLSPSSGGPSVKVPALRQSGCARQQMNFLKKKLFKERLL